MTDYEFMLADRIGVIRSVHEKYDLDRNAYISFSGGKDSTILHYLLDMALPGNRIPRVFIDTGIEYNMIREFVFSLAEKDDRFEIVKPRLPIVPMLKKDGYPFKSKEHSLLVSVYQNSGMCKSVRYYLGIEGYKLITCPNILRYQFSREFSLKIGCKCCLRMKKEPIKEWVKDNKRPIYITGMRKSEGGQRMSLKGCVLTDNDGNLKRFHPLLVVSDEWETEFVKSNNVQLCKLYYPPFNFRRTGCKGCPFALDLQEQLTIMQTYLPSERAQCEAIWKPIYDEYRRIGYRLDSVEQLKLF